MCLSSCSGRRTEMARRTFTMVDVTEILQHWYAGRPKVEVARSLGVDAKTVRRYVAAAEAAGMAPGGPPVTEERWRALARGWFPQIAGTGIRQVSWRQIAVHHDRIAELLGVVPVSVIHQRLADEQGLEASVASVRRYVRAHFPDRRGLEVRMHRPPSAPGAEAQVDYGYLGLWPDPATGRRRRVRAFSMVLPYSRHLFVRPTVSMTGRAWTEAHVAAFEFLGGCARRLVPDNLKAGVCKPDLYDPKINRGYAELARHYGCLVGPARAYHPRDKAVIEAHQRYIRSSFFAGRSWSSLAAMTAGAEAWCTQVAGQRRPWRLTGTRLDARATAAMVEFYLDGELVKTHPFQPRGRRTDWADLPGHKAGFYMRTDLRPRRGNLVRADAAPRRERRLDRGLQPPPAALGLPDDAPGCLRAIARRGRGGGSLTMHPVLRCPASAGARHRQGHTSSLRCGRCLDRACAPAVSVMAATENQAPPRSALFRSQHFQGIPDSPPAVNYLPGNMPGGYRRRPASSLRRSRPAPTVVS